MCAVTAITIGVHVVCVTCSCALTDCWIGDKPLNEGSRGRRQGTGSSQDDTEPNLRSGRDLSVM